MSNNTLIIRKSRLNMRNQINPLKGYYVIVDKRGDVRYNTMSCQRKTCISNFLEGGSITWAGCKKIGWRCLKVDVTFKNHKR